MAGMILSPYGTCCQDQEEASMPQVEVDGLTISHEVQGEGEPLLLIPYTSADHACYAFQLPAYTEHFRCIAVDLPGTGESDKPDGPYSTAGYADQLAAFLGDIGIERPRRWWTSYAAARPSRWTRSWPRPMRSSPTTRARPWARSTYRPSSRSAPATWCAPRGSPSR